jgi:hypothetical protein
LRNHSIEKEHPQYTVNRRIWQRYNDLYAGGEQIAARATDYLVRRHNEGADVYSERLARMFYENYIGSIIDWYAATLLRREPVVQFDGDDTRGKRFFDLFIQDCDRKNTALSDFYQQQLTDALVYGKAYALVDFPKIDGVALTRAEEDAAGKSRAYLSRFLPEQLTNWGRNAQGEFEWVVLKTESIHQPSLGADAVHETLWTYYDREIFETYRRQGSPGSGTEVALVDSGPHALAGQRRVPLFELKVPEGLWLMNRAALLQLEHMNKSNALAWALTMGLFAMPVVYSNKEFTQTVGESYYLQLGQDDRLGWTEPEGRVYGLAADNLNRLKDEIYRVCYLLSQASKSDAGGLPQSGLSKQMDFSITQEILGTYGDAVKSGLRQVLQAVVAARKDDLTVAVSGLDEFDIGDFSTELQNASSLLALGIPSKTLKEQMFKKLAFKYLNDARQDLKNTIAEEIDAAFAESPRAS